ncbi:threonine-phosphate decarboxylase [Pseudoroseicyclus tamaricis]|uniref:threonine-phosphate decarboxylase n=1 Tax=Pseudoroseicyclus tamaricis TaxID=2705421 RepID=UPI001F27A1C6|nr:threonine-phosphate decarboxylase [Pseudoroseicyclus tamaricis]
MNERDHGGGLDAAIARWGGERDGWLDLSTGINPVPYPLGDISPGAWTALPDKAAAERLKAAARSFWQVPEGAGVLAAPGASALIARLPALWPKGHVEIAEPTYNEWRAAFDGAGWATGPGGATVAVHPNNPDGRLAPPPGAGLTIYDESFCDVMPGASHVARAGGDVLILKSFGKFWGLAGLRLGFLIGAPEPLARMAEMLGPWPVSGPALEVGARALEDAGWAEETRARLAADADRLDALIQGAGARVAGGTTLFRLYEVEEAAAWQERLAEHHVWSRVFPYAPGWLRLGLPAPERWAQLEAAL